jgi:hypothetical protein
MTDPTNVLDEMRCCACGNVWHDLDDALNQYPVACPCGSWNTEPTHDGDGTPMAVGWTW